MEVEIIGHHTNSSTSFLKPSFTVLFRQVYELRTTLNSHCYTVNRRYKQFLGLHQQCRPTAQFPLPPLPKKTLHAKSESVIEERTAALEIYLQVAALDPALWPILRVFLEIPASEVIKNDEDLSLLSDGEALVVKLMTAIQTDPSNKLSSLIDFSRNFFRKSQVVNRKYAKLLITTLIPLCGDEVSGSYALELVNKLISPAVSRCCREVVWSLMQCSTQELALIQLDKHVLGRFQGDSIAQALTLIALFSEHLPRRHALLEVVNGNQQALDVFRRWKSEELEPKGELPVEELWRRSECEDMPELVVEYRAGKGVLEINVVLEGIQASVYRICDCIVIPTNRLHWDRLIQVARLIEQLSATESILELQYEDNDGGLVPYILHCTVTYLRGSEVVVTYHHWVPPSTLGPFIVSYHIEQSPLRTSFCSEVDLNTSPETPLPMEIGPHCSISYKAQFTGDLMRIRLEDFANDRQMFVGIWKALKTFAETEEPQSPTSLNTALDKACANKILAPRLHCAKLEELV